VAIIALAVAAIGGGAVIVQRSRARIEPRPQATSEQDHLAVIPFKDEGGASDAQLFSIGLAEAVRQRLAEFPGIRVVDPRYLPASAAAESDPTRAARALGATLVLTGGVKRSDDDLRVTYRLFQPATGGTLGQRTIRGSMRDLWTIRDQIVTAVADDLDIHQQPARNRSSGLGTAEEQEIYLRALGSMDRAADAPALDAAINGLRELLETSANSPLVHAALGRAYYLKYAFTRDGQWIERAARAARQAISLDADSLDALVTLGTVETVHGNYAQAATAFQRALTLHPASATAAIGLGQTFTAEKRYDEAERMFRRGIAQQPTWWYGHHMLATLFWQRARYDDALREYNSVIRLDPGRSSGYSGAGTALLRQDRLSEAAAMFRKALSLNEDPSARSNLAYCQFYAGEYEKAADSMRVVVGRYPAKASYWANLAEACAASSKYRGEAAGHYRTAAERARAELAISPQYGRAHGTLALALAHTGDLRGARQSIRRALDLEPENPSHLLEAARIANVAGDAPQAIAYLEQALARGASAREIERHPEFGNLRGNPALQEILDRKAQTLRSPQRKEAA
jgi:tetratricopeptide (TPR) repeat protein/TolB-like protein